MGFGQEQVYLTTRPTRLAHIPSYTLALLLLIGSGLIYLLRPSVLATPVLFTSLATIVAWVVGFLGVVLLMRLEIRRLLTRYTFTNMRVIKRRGFIRRTEEYAMLSKIERVEVDQGLIQRVLGTGDIILDTGDMDAVILFGLRDVRNVEQGLARTLSNRGH